MRPGDDPRGGHEQRDGRDEALDARLRAAYAPPGDVSEIARRALRAALEGQAGGRTTDSATPPAGVPAGTTELRVRRLRRVAAAAAVLLAAAGLAWWWSDGDEVVEDGAPPVAADPGGSVIGSVYADAVREFEASGALLSACQSPHGLADLFDERHGAPLYVRIDPERPVIGPFACTALPGVTVLCGVTAAGPIAIVVGASGEPAPAGLESDGSLNCFRRDLGGLVLFELSPLDAPACLDLFSTRPE
jgi:hypothetical protein